MKNIFLVPTDNPSKIFYIAENFHLEKGQLIEPKSYYHIYITNSEEIKEGDWCLEFIYEDKLNVVKWKLQPLDTSDYKKIILTTDSTLIADGVQAIDNEFLEWFVKNPSCEEIEIGDWFNEILSCCRSKEECHCNKKRIIIPQEEPKQEKWDKLNKEFDDALLVLREYLIANKEEVVKDLEQMHEWSNANKKETVEAIVERMFPFTDNDAENRIITIKRLYWIDGAKWQAERMYSEAIEFAEWIRIKDFQTTSKDNWIGLDMKYYTTQELFEQFKKK
jgi:hypothetical protein